MTSSCTFLLDESSDISSVFLCFLGYLGSVDYGGRVQGMQSVSFDHRVTVYLSDNYDRTSPNGDRTY